ncbi:hypothetical protein [Actinoplanes palleronii]|uniref:Tetratricopeptide repeat protein n=1 Tax=Actinoplanes palleronii TaxID=113570 RepID=A0ABQ4BPN9_9ACTN|nr:hypothetical protein [Actinoplanes palleronii]GIE72628.1 hypothetical protein Apa02nite_087360 [Actinoplanes palleronii]
MTPEGSAPWNASHGRGQAFNIGDGTQVQINNFIGGPAGVSRIAAVTSVGDVGGALLASAADACLRIDWQLLRVPLTGGHDRTAHRAEVLIVVAGDGAVTGDDLARLTQLTASGVPRTLAFEVDGATCLRGLPLPTRVRAVTDGTDLRQEIIKELQRIPAMAGRPAPPENRSVVSGPPAFRAFPPYVGSADFVGRQDDLWKLSAWAMSADPVMVVKAIGGVGKSALAWHWSTTEAPVAIPELAGRFWWSFYDGSASILQFLKELYAYVTGEPRAEADRMAPADLAGRVVEALREQPYLIVLDGVERLMSAYHRHEPALVRDEDADASPRTLVEPLAESFLRSLLSLRQIPSAPTRRVFNVPASAGPEVAGLRRGRTGAVISVLGQRPETSLETLVGSRILITTRLMPTTLSRSGHLQGGARELALDGLSRPDTRALAGQLQISGNPRELGDFFDRLGNHPLLIGIVAALVRDYRPAPGDFDRWLADPNAGGALSASAVDLAQRRTHILDVAMRDLDTDSQRLLGWLSVMGGGVDWETIDTVNPFGTGPESADVRRRLDAALHTLEDRGLLWWDRLSNRYDMHPIVRGFVQDKLDRSERFLVHEQIRDHFEALPPDSPGTATSVEDLRNTIMIYRALLGTERPAEAADVWNRQLRNALVHDIGAVSTTIELLGPLAHSGPVGVRADLAIALNLAARYDEAIAQERDLLADLLAEGRTDAVVVSLDRLSTHFEDDGNLVAAVRYTELREELLAVHGRGVDPVVCLVRARRAIIAGRVIQGGALLDTAAAMAPPTNAPWFAGSLRYWQLYLAALDGAGDDLVEQLTEAWERTRTWRHRRDLGRLLCDVLEARGDYVGALELALKVDEVERDAGAETVPARIACLLARTGRLAEAAEALDEAMSRYDRLPPAARPLLALAVAHHELGRAEEAADLATQAYLQVWRGGQPYLHHWEMLKAEQLLKELDVAPPAAPPTDPDPTDSLAEAVATYIVEERDLVRYPLRRRQSV